MGLLRRLLVGKELTEGEWSVVRMALETQERVMTERGAGPAAESARQVRIRLFELQGR